MTGLGVLHTLRCIGYAGADRVAEIARISPDAAESDLLDLAVAGLATYEPGPFGGWGITEAGRKADAEHVRRELDESGARGAVDAAYGRFLPLNSELLDLCTAWQLGPGGPDSAYRERVLGLFGDFDARAAEVIGELERALARFGRYRERLGTALARARGGEHAFVTDGVDSYHSIWFHLHEDLLSTLDLTR